MAPRYRPLANDAQRLHYDGNVTVTSEYPPTRDNAIASLIMSIEALNIYYKGICTQTQVTILHQHPAVASVCLSILLMLT